MPCLARSVSKKRLTPTFLCTGKEKEKKRKSEKEKKREKLKKKKIKTKKKRKRRKKINKIKTKKPEARRKSEKGLTPTFLCTQASNPYLDVPLLVVVVRNAVVT